MTAAVAKEAFVLAAGRGTRLRPLTLDRPKALVEVGGVPLLEHVARRLVAAGVRDLVVNAHAFAEAIEAFVRERDAFGAHVRIAHEPDRPLETGGGLLAARSLFRARGPILVHNVDVLTDLDLQALARAHVETGALATLAVMERESTRQLLFDDAGLVGRVDREKDLELRVRAPVGAVRALAFSGIHVLDPSLLDRIEERGAFSILRTWLRLAGEGARLLPYRADGARWIDVGRPADLARARATWTVR